MIEIKPDPLETALGTSSVKYNKSLALLSAEMCDAAYKDSNKGIEQYLKNMGFEDRNIHSNNYSSGIKLGSLAFTIATKEMDAVPNTSVMVIVCRGSTNWYELFQDSFSVADKKYGKYKVYGVVNDFNNAIREYYDKYKQSGRQYRILITGHSLGGASANLFAAKLNKEWGKQNVYCYTFGAINSIKSSVPVTDGYENIHNVYNNKDTFAPGQFSKVMKNGAGSKYGKFGHLETFDKDWRTASDKRKKVIVQIMDHINHDMYRYVEAVKTINNGKGKTINYKKHCTEHYRIPAKTTVTKVKSGKRSIKLSWKKVANKTPGGTKGYQIQYSTGKKFIKKKTKTIKSFKTINTAINNLSGGKPYYVRVRSYIKYKDDTFFSPWSKVEKVTTK